MAARAMISEAASRSVSRAISGMADRIGPALSAVNRRRFMSAT